MPSYIINYRRKRISVSQYECARKGVVKKSWKEGGEVSTMFPFSKENREPTLGSQRIKHRVFSEIFSIKCQSGTLKLAK